jgi:hypothetical protein
MKLYVITGRNVVLRNIVYGFINQFMINIARVVVLSISWPCVISEKNNSYFMTAD